MTIYKGLSGGLLCRCCAQGLTAVSETGLDVSRMSQMKSCRSLCDNANGMSQEHEPRAIVLSEGRRGRGSLQRSPKDT
jgi:hypothetical protein